MAQLWPEKIDGDTIGKGLKKIGFTRKSGATPRRFAALGNAHQDERLTPTENATTTNAERS